LITDPDAEQFSPGQSRQLAELVAGRADLIRFTAEKGAAYPCRPTGRLLIENRMFDWLAAFTSVEGQRRRLNLAVHRMEQTDEFVAARSEAQQAGLCGAQP
jgi:hypothetical protein